MKHIGPIIALIVITSLVPTGVSADYIMGPAEVNDSLKALARLRKQSQSAKNADERADALFKLAEEASYLVSMINLEVRAHGREQEQLIKLAIRRSEESGVVIAYDSTKRTYLYNGDAFAEYLKLRPSGPHEQEARFMVIEKTFYAQKSDDRTGVTALIGEIEAFLSRYPGMERRSELELFLGVLYRDLYLNEAKAGGGLAEKAKAEQVCRALIKSYPNSREARVAQAILNSLKQ